VQVGVIAPAGMSAMAAMGLLPGVGTDGDAMSRRGQRDVEVMSA
jgi:hypothetical protein